MSARWPATAVLSVLLLASCQLQHRTAAPTLATGPAVASAPAGAPAAVATPADRRRGTWLRQVIGRSVRGVSLIAWFSGPTTAGNRVLVIGCVHGNERAGIAVSLALLRSTPAPGTELVVVPDLNPDGAARGTRQNAHGVDLNRNFPYRWRPLGRLGDQQFSGSGPLSEPESRAMAALVNRVRPTVTVWFHQPEDVVDLSGGSAGVEREFARVAGLGVRRLVRYPGSATGWQNATWPGTTAFVVELPHRVDGALSRRLVSALYAVERSRT